MFKLSFYENNTHLIVFFSDIKPDFTLIKRNWKKLTPVRRKHCRLSREDALFKEKPISLSETKNYMNPENIVKKAKNGHVLMLIKKSRLRGVCVECLKKSNGTEKFPKIISHCPQCPGGVWLCEPCFDITHF